MRGKKQGKRQRSMKAKLERATSDVASAVARGCCVSSAQTTSVDEDLAHERQDCEDCLLRELSVQLG